ncbi:response regulator [Actinophytocola sp.]|uniref:response regulator n=1 Tax=Actinophytocola sp. TaxID=1872138 RepID=UPI0039C857C5
MVRGGLRALVEADGVRVVGEARTGRAAVRQVQRHRPDVLLTDLEPGEPDGIAAIEEVRRPTPATAVLVFHAVRGPRVAARRAAGGRAGVPAQGGRGGRHPARDPERRRRRGDLRPDHRRPAGRPVRRQGAGSPPVSRPDRA